MYLCSYNNILSGPPNSQRSVKKMPIIGSDGFKVDLDNHSAAFPTPFFFQMEKLGPPPECVTIVNYSTLFFHKIDNETAGTYTISAANYHLQNKAEQIGLGTTNLTLNVLCKLCNIVNVHSNICIFLSEDGPFLSEGPREYYVLLGDSVTLICGYNLDSNPKAVITWIDPLQKPVANNSNYQQHNGPELVQLNIPRVGKSHSGTWKCNISVTSGAKLIGNQSYSIQLNVVGKHDIVVLSKIKWIHAYAMLYSTETPMSINVSINATGYTWVVLNWTFPGNISSNIKRLEITTVSINGTGTIIPVDCRRSNKNITNLDLDTAYDFSIMVVSDVNGTTGRSLPSYHVKIGK